MKISSIVLLVVATVASADTDGHVRHRMLKKNQETSFTPSPTQVPIAAPVAAPGASPVAVTDTGAAQVSPTSASLMENCCELLNTLFALNEACLEPTRELYRALATRSTPTATIKNATAINQCEEGPDSIFPIIEQVKAARLNQLSFYTKLTFETKLESCIAGQSAIDLAHIYTPFCYIELPSGVL
jgi:hypothetical protein